MLVYLVRHAIARPREESTTIADADRALTEKGTRRMREIVRGLSNAGVQLDEIWTSPYLRARQTAELLAELRGFDGPIRNVTELEPGGDCDRVAARLSEAADRDAVALVGHEPDMGCLATWLLTGSQNGVIAFKKGGTACIELDPETAPPRGELRWLLTPRQMRQLA